MTEPVADNWRSEVPTTPGVYAVIHKPENVELIGAVWRLPFSDGHYPSPTLERLYLRLPEPAIDEWRNR